MIFNRFDRIFCLCGFWQLLTISKISKGHSPDMWRLGWLHVFNLWGSMLPRLALEGILLRDSKTISFFRIQANYLLLSLFHKELKKRQPDWACFFNRWSYNSMDKTLNIDKAIWNTFDDLIYVWEPKMGSD